MTRKELGIFDFDTREGRARFDEVMATVEGELRVVTEDPESKRRSDRQNHYYWPVFCTRFALWLSRTHGYTATKDHAHNIFKESLLRVPETDENGEQIFMPNGEPSMRTRSTTELSTREFNEYLDRCAELMQDMDERYKAPPKERYHEPITPQDRAAETRAKRKAEEVAARREVARA